MIILNYGLHWVRDKVWWGIRGRGNQGDLLGKLSNRANSPDVNFREQAGIYVLQDGFRPLYVGQTGVGVGNRLFVRLRAHTRNHLAERWDRFSWFGIEAVVNDGIVAREHDEVQTTVADVLDHVEGVLISITEPPLNRQGARFGDADQYRQVVHADEGDEEE